jgi:hypothetical protein
MCIPVLLSRLLKIPSRFVQLMEKLVITCTRWPEGSFVIHAQTGFYLPARGPTATRDGILALAREADRRGLHSATVVPRQLP